LTQGARFFAFGGQEVFQVLPNTTLGPCTSQIVFTGWFQDWSIRARTSLRVAFGVILSAALGINQNIAGIRDLYEGLRSLGRAAVEIRMMQTRQPLVGRLDLCY
jgi:hypothetical protein